MAALQEAKKKPAKYKLAETLARLVLNPDQGNSWNAVRSLRSIAATVVSAGVVIRCLRPASTRRSPRLKFSPLPGRKPGHVEEFLWINQK